MKQGNCIFCNKKLDNSKEHIIPDCLNGKLTSRKIVCHACNKLFGEHIDSEIKTQLNPILLFMGFKNAKQFHVVGGDNKKYLLKKNLTLEPIKPEIYLRGKSKKKRITITGKKKDIKGVLKRMNEILETEIKIKGAKFVIADEKMNLGVIPSTNISLDLKITDKITLLFNKIALEFWAINGCDLQCVAPLLAKVHTLDSNLNNVVFCNSDNEIRDFNSTEISHVIVLIGDSKEGKLRAYIELFNIYCGIVNLSDSYTGNDIKYSYQQDALTGKKFDSDIILKTSIIEAITSEANNDGLLTLCSFLSERQKERHLSEVLDLNLKAIMDNLKSEAKKGTIKESEIPEMYVRQAANVIGQLAFLIPYSIEIDEGKQPHENDQYNLLHSNFKPENVDAFIEKNKHILNIKIVINDEMYRFASFFKEIYRVNRDVDLIKLYMVLESFETKQTHYMPIRQVFDILHSAKPLDGEQVKKYSDDNV